MRLILSLVLGFLFSLPLTASCIAQEKILTIKKLEADAAHTWDFGQVEEGAILKHNFTLKNDSKRLLRILAVDTSCGCTTSKVKSKVLIPGAETQVEAQFDSSGYSGPVEQFIYVHTNRIIEPEINFKIKVDVIKNKKQEG